MSIFRSSLGICGPGYSLRRESQERHFPKGLPTQLPTSRTPIFNGTKGKVLARALAGRCATLEIHPNRSVIEFHVDPQHHISYCPVEKVASTFWRRVFFMGLSENNGKYTSPYDVPILDAISHEPKKKFTQRLSKVMGKMSEVFLFVRDPYSRLLSAYIDKFIAPNPYYWHRIGRKTIELYRRDNNGKRILGSQVHGHDVTFEEFMRYVRDYETIGKADPHVVSIHRACKPCFWNYTFVGKMENFKDDAFYVLEKMKMYHVINHLQKDFSLEKISDSVIDSIHSVFGWRENITRIISWEKALRRVWLKLQLQGIISSDLGFDPPDGDWDTVTEHRLIDAAMEAHRKSDQGQLKRQKKQVKKEAFSTVSLRHIDRFRQRFIGDFVLFNYDDAPDVVFNRYDQWKVSLFNFSHLN